MSRAPKARLLILDAAERIVKGPWCGQLDL
jgi:hypothetical protein